MAGLCPQLSCVFVVVTSLQLLHVQGSLTVTGVHHPVTQVACRYPRKDLFILTLKQTANTSSVRSADIMDTCRGDMMFSACTFDDTCVTVKALVVGQEFEEFRVFECKATLKVNSESREILVGQINITVGGLTAPPHTTASLGVMEATGGLRQPVFTETCVSRDAQPTVIIALVVLLVVVIVINAVLVVVILKLRGLGRSHVTEGTTSLTPCAADPPPTASGSRGGNAQNETANGNEGERTSKKSDSSTSSPGQAAGNGSKSGGSTPRSSSSGSDKPSTNPNYTSTALQEVEIHPYMDLHTRDPTYASTTSSKDPHMYMELKTLKALQPGSEKNGNDGYETPQVPGQANKSSDGYETPQPPREGRRRSATYANQGVPADPIQEEVNYYNEA